MANLDLSRVLSNHALSELEAESLMNEIMEGNLSPVATSAILTALRVRGETVPEIVGFARGMRAKAVRVPVQSGGVLVDVVGTGGDGANTFNISTTAAFVVAAAGVAVAKHGNRSASSKAGSADVLEALGVNLEQTPERVAEAVRSVGVGFMFARNHHPAMRHVAPVRAELRVRTVFNLLGPLTNPAGASHSLIGVYDAKLVRPIAEVLHGLGSRAAMVVNGSGLDELTVCGLSHIAELRDGSVREYTLEPQELGLGLYETSSLAGGDPSENAVITREILAGRGSSAQRDVTALNAGAALFTAGAANSLETGVQRALEILASGAGLSKLEAYAKFTQQH
jgi:anthranilate phosphoribosyltransferase